MGTTADAELAVLARGQHGCFSCAQARARGVTASQVEGRVAKGSLRALHRGVYALTGVPPTWEQALMAATLAVCGVASHRAAAALWQLRGCESGIVEVTAVRQHKPVLARVVAHTTRRLEVRDTTRRLGIPVTTPERTLLDLAAVAAGPAVESAMEDALLRRITTYARVRELSQRLGVPGRDGSGVLRRLLAARDPALAPTESCLEDAVVRLLRAAGLPEPQRQVWIRVPGRAPIRLDLAYPDDRLALECDGVVAHSLSADVQRDAAKANLLLDLGWRLLRFTWRDVRERPAEIVALVRRHRRTPAA